MQWILFLLVLMGQCSFFTCRLYEYHFIDQNRTWNEAQTYCRENYTDLATVFDMTDMKRLHDSMDHCGAWIGLYNEPGGKKEWHWSLPGVEYYKNETWWKIGEPNDALKVENCVFIKPNHSWVDGPCNEPHSFICYNESMKSDKTFHLISERMTWPEAQKYCREHHTDLVSGYNQLQNLNVTIPEHWEGSWIGLFRDTWRWSDGNHSSFRNWENLEVSNYIEDEEKCAVIKNETGKLCSWDCNIMKPFVCYEDKVILIKEEKTWDEALNYCREKYRDLASITDHNEQLWIREKAKNASTDFVWLGLRYTCTLDLWFWVSDEAVSYENWASNTTNDDCDMSGAMQREREYKWFKKNDTDKFNFICSKC